MNTVREIVSLGSAPAGWAAVYSVRGDLVRRPVLAWALVDPGAPGHGGRAVVGVVLDDRRPVLADQVEGAGLFRGYTAPDEDPESLRACHPDSCVWLS